MKIKDIYAMQPIHTSYDVYSLLNCWHPHIKEVENLQLNYDKADCQSRIEIRTYYDPYIDSERCCTISAAYFDNSPVMLFRYAGRSGHDAYDEFITDREAYNRMVSFIRELCHVEPEESFDEDQDLECLDTFYGCDFNIINGKLNDQSYVESQDIEVIRSVGEELPVEVNTRK